MNETLPVGLLGTFWIILYLISLLGIGWWGKLKARGHTQRDFYLASSSLGVFVLTLTLFATQYSGNTMLGFPGETYRLGAAYVMSITFMMAIIAAYLLYAPRLHALSEVHKFLTPGDWIQHRFRSRPLTMLASCFMLFALSNYILAQLMALGHTMRGFTGGLIPYAAGVIGLALIIVAYESLGGMRSVVWTDVIQGVLLFFGMMALMVLLVTKFGLGGGLGEKIVELVPEKFARPEASTLRTWLSSILLVGLGGAFYPQAIQRIYAATSTRVLKRSLSFMAFMPLVTVLPAFLIGIVAIASLPGLGQIGSDRVVPILLSHILTEVPAAQPLVILLLGAILAAIMSTADSALLSASSIMINDLYQPISKRRLSDQTLTRLGKLSSWVLMIILVTIAITPRITLWRLLEIKFEILLQVTPAFLLGLYWPRLRARSVLIGMISGALFAVGATVLGVPKPWGIHAGVLGVGLNAAICVAYHWFSARRHIASNL